VRPSDSQPTNTQPSNSGGNKAPDPTAVELSYWEAIKNSIDPDDFKKYLERYPTGRFAGLAKRRMDSAQVLADKKSSNLNTSPKPSVPSTVPNPVIIFAGVESRESGGKSIARYTYTVTNWEDYLVELFAAAPDLPPCGRNTRSSRTWVDLYDSSGKRLYGFCALGTLRGSGILWFDLYTDVIPPRGVYIEMTDRKTGKKYKSNVAETLLETRENTSEDVPTVANSKRKACNFVLGPEIYRKWIENGGEKGVLGCPILDDSEAGRSPQGTTGRFSRFDNGNAAIHCHQSGRYSGSCFVLKGPIYVEYTNLGGSGSWLGLPTSEEHDVVLADCENGCRAVDFEGGHIVLNSKTGSARSSKSIKRP
jgi:hypothetical protein